MILREIINSEKMVVTSLIDRISKKYELPESTLRWNIKQLRERGLVECGTKDSKGIPISLTGDGLIIKGILGVKNG